jgi:hypothetical protein
MADDDNKYTFSKDARQYTLIARQHSGFDKATGLRREFTTGDKVWLELDQYEAFKDKFEDKTQKGSSKDEPEFTPTQPQEKPGEKKDPAPNAAKTSPNSGDTGAGSVANSTSSQKV